MFAIWEDFWSSWPAVSLNSAATFSLSVSDINSTSNPLVINLSTMTLGSTFNYNPGFPISTGGTTIILPVTPVLVAFLVNVGANPIQLTWTPFNLTPLQFATLQPGGWTFLGETSQGSGITALSATAVNSSSTLQFLLLG
jgi:hypothetical protein